MTVEPGGSAVGDTGAAAGGPDLPGVELRERVGGTVAAVHRGVLTGSGRVVAVKVLDAGATPEAREALRREAAVLDRVDHPHVLGVLDVLEPADGRLALVLPWAPGGTLAGRLARRGPLPPDEVCELGARLAEALGALHAVGVLHADVNPTNVLFDAEDVALLADLDAALPHGVVPADGLRATAEYLDPALHAGGPAVASADGWSLGVTLYEAASGRLPHAGSTPEATVRAAARGGHVPLEHLVAACPRGLATTVAGLLAADPSARPSLADVAVTLDGARLAAGAGAAGGEGGPTAGGGAGAAGVLGRVDDPGAAAAPTTPATTPARSPQPAAPPAGPPSPAPPPAAPTPAPAAVVGTEVVAADRAGGALAGRGATPPSGPRSGGTRRFGPPPPAPARGGGGDRRWWWLLAAGLVVLLPLLALGLLRGGGDAAPDTPVATAPATTAPASDPATPDPGATSPAAVRPAPCAGDAPPAGAGPDAVLLVGDLDGSGCSVTLAWEAGVLTLPAGAAGDEPERFALGEPTDVPLLGDWACDGTWTPGVYRPATGQLFLFDGVAGADGELTSRPALDTGVVGGVPVVVDPAGDGCHTVEVRPT
ncbi:MAG: serine/threonine-protein kinase [Actinomycetes bacterium]